MYLKIRKPLFNQHQIKRQNILACQKPLVLSSSHKLPRDVILCILITEVTIAYCCNSYKWDHIVCTVIVCLDFFFLNCMLVRFIHIV